MGAGAKGRWGGGGPGGDFGHQVEHVGVPERHILVHDDLALHAP